MVCPKCGAPVEPEQKTCEKCGASLSEKGIDVVFSGRKSMKHRRSSVRNIVVIAFCVLIFCSVVSLVILLLNRGNEAKAESKKIPSETSQASSETVPATVQPTTAAANAATQAATEASTQAATEAATQATGESSTQPTTESEMSVQKKLEDYVKNSGLYEDLLAWTDEYTELDMVYVERNLVSVQYTLTIDTQDETQQNYTSVARSYFTALCGSLDANVNDMKQKTGVSDAQIVVDCIDIAGNHVYSGRVD